MSEYYTLGSWDNKGVPDYLASQETIPPDLINRIITLLPERAGITTTHPNFLDSSIPRNILIKSNDSNFIGADVYVTFLYEGAGYRNTVGYYHYPLNDQYTVPTKWSQSAWTPMTYNDRNSIDSNGKSILKKTIIFPNASLPTWANNNGQNTQAGGGNLLPGAKVRLLYDTANPTALFPNNTGIGFFVIPDGWHGNKFTNANERIYTDAVFNNGSVQTVVLFDSINSTESLGRFVIAFEDIMRPDGDSDFNDVIIDVSYNPVMAVNTDNYLVLPDDDPITDDNIIIDRTGMYMQLKNSTVTSYLNQTSVSMMLDHTISFDSEESCNLLKTIFENLNLNNDGSIIASGSNYITCRYTVLKNKIQNYIYFFSSFHNVNTTSPLNPNVSILVDFQNLYTATVNNISNQHLKIFNQNATVYSDGAVVPKKQQFNSPYALGDPHIMTIYGEKYDLPNTTKIYCMYDDGELIINGKLDHFYMNEPHPEYKNLTFLSYVGLRIYDEFMIINMFHPDTYYDAQYRPYKNKSDRFVFTKFLNNQRIAHYESILKTRQFELRYIIFSTFRLGTVCLELMFIPHRKDVVNAISIICNNQYIANAKGILVGKNTKSEDLIVNSIIS